MKTKVEELTISQLLEFYSRKSEETYNTYRSAIYGEDESFKDQSYKNWSHADDCLVSVHKIIEQARQDLI